MLICRHQILVIFKQPLQGHHNILWTPTKMMYHSIFNFVCVSVLLNESSFICCVIYGGMLPIGLHFYVFHGWIYLFYSCVRLFRILHEQTCFPKWMYARKKILFWLRYFRFCCPITIWSGGAPVNIIPLFWLRFFLNLNSNHNYYDSR